MREPEGGVLYAVNPGEDMWRKIENDNHRSADDHEARCRGRPYQIFSWTG